MDFDIAMLITFSALKMAVLKINIRNCWQMPILSHNGLRLHGILSKYDELRFENLNE